MQAITDNTRMFLTPQEVADELRMDVRAIYAAVNAGTLPAIQLHKRGNIRIPASALRPQQR